MNVERARKLLHSLPHVCETMQWGENLVFWAGDKAIGGKMFALMSLDAATGQVISFSAGQEAASELCEREGLRPAPYFARIHWVAAEAWDALPDREWEQVLRAAYEITLAKLSKRTCAALALPLKERKALIAERRSALARAAEEAKGQKAKRSEAQRTRQRAK